jgi:uncharacterized protein involved in exopolysaccharide biosynthesis
MRELTPPGYVTPADAASVHIQAIRNRWWMVVLGALVAGAIAYAASASGQKEYAAQASVLLTGAEPVNVLSGTTVPATGDPERDLNTEVALVKLQSVATDVINQLHLSVTPTQLLREVSVTPQGTTNLVAIAATDPKPRQAAAISNAFANRYLVVRRQLAQASYQDAAKLAQQRIDDLSAAQLTQALGRTLRRQMRQLEVTGSLQTGDAQLVDPATPPTSPSAPKPKTAGIVGALLGALIGALAAIAAGAASRRQSSSGLTRDSSVTGKTGRASTLWNVRSSRTPESDGSVRATTPPQGSGPPQARWDNGGSNVGISSAEPDELVSAASRGKGKQPK